MTSLPTATIRMLRDNRTGAERSSAQFMTLDTLIGYGMRFRRVFERDDGVGMPPEHLLAITRALRDIMLPNVGLEEMGGDDRFISWAFLTGTLPIPREVLVEALEVSDGRAGRRVPRALGGRSRPQRPAVHHAGLAAKRPGRRGQAGGTYEAGKRCGLGPDGRLSVHDPRRPRAGAVIGGLREHHALLRGPRRQLSSAGARRPPGPARAKRTRGPPSSTPAWPKLASVPDVEAAFDESRGRPASKRRTRGCRT